MSRDKPEHKPLITASSIARMAGNIAAGMIGHPRYHDGIPLHGIAETSVRLAYLIASEIEKHEPFQGADTGRRGA